MYKTKNYTGFLYIMQIYKLTIDLLFYVNNGIILKHGTL